MVRRLDLALLTSVAVLICLGLIMVASASVSIADRQLGDPLYYFNRQLLFVVLGLLSMVGVYRVRLAFWERTGPLLLLILMFMLTLVLIPGIGKTVNGSSRWLALGLFNLQVSELAKLFIIVYIAGYLVRRREQVCASWSGFLKPVLVISLVCLLLLLEPDFGAAVVLMVTALGLLFLGGVRFWQFITLLMSSSGVMAILALSSEYRLERITAFLDPWNDPYSSGFQLTQSLIAIGSGAWFGVGLGGSIQKLFYLPEAHTDFLFAVLAEELGLIGVIVVIALYTVLVWRCFLIGSYAEAQGQYFGAFLSYGIGIWLGLQAFINMGVNMGLLPTKGLTLPFMSAGGSSMLVVCLAIGLLSRVQREVNEIKAPSAHSGSMLHRVM